MILNNEDINVENVCIHVHTHIITGFLLASVKKVKFFCIVKI